MNEELVKALEMIESTLKVEKDENLINEITNKLESFIPREELTLDAVQKFVSENKSGKEYLKGLITNTKKEAIDEYTKSKNYNKTIEAQIKEAVSKREEELRKEMDKTLTPEQIKIAELEKKQIETEKMLQLKEIKLEAANTIQEKKLHKDLLEFVIDPMSIENTNANIEKVSILIDQLVKQGVEAEFRNIGRDPQKASTAQAISQKMLDDLAAKAKASGKLEDRVKYAQMKQSYNEQNVKH